MAELLAEGQATKKSVSIHVEHDNPARRLYHRLGFRHVDTYGVYHLLDGGRTRRARLQPRRSPARLAIAVRAGIERTVMDLASLTCEAARALQGTPFRVELANGTVVSLRLDDVLASSRVSVAGRERGPPRREPFALYFLGP